MAVIFISIGVNLFYVFNQPHNTEFYVHIIDKHYPFANCYTWSAFCSCGFWCCRTSVLLRGKFNLDLEFAKPYCGSWSWKWSDMS